MLPTRSSSTNSNYPTAILWRITRRCGLCHRHAYAPRSRPPVILRPVRSHAPCTFQCHRASPPEGRLWKVQILRRHSNPYEFEYRGLDGILGKQGVDLGGITWWRCGRGHILGVSSRGVPLRRTWMLDGQQDFAHSETLGGSLWKEMKRVMDALHSRRDVERA